MKDHPYNIILGMFVALFIGAATYAISQQTVKVTEPTKTYGAVSGPDWPYDYFSINGVARYAARKSLVANASTTCSIKSPNATSTIGSSGVRVTNGSAGALIFEIGRGTDAYSTTTLIGTTNTIAAGAQGFIQASTSPGGVSIFPPNTYFNVKVAGASLASTTGVCQAEFVAY